MRLRLIAVLAISLAGALAPSGLGAQQPAAPGPAARPLASSLDALSAGLGRIEALSGAGRAEEARQAALRLYLDDYEVLEASYGVGGGEGTPALAARIGAIEGRFHELLRAADAAHAAALAAELRGEIEGLRTLAASDAGAALAGGPPRNSAQGAGAPGGGAAPAPGAQVRSRELRRVLAQLDSAERVYRQGAGAEALARVERLYLDGIEPLESRLPQTRVHEIEQAVHLGVRASMGAGAPAGETLARFAELRAGLVAADGVLGAGAPAWLGAANAFFVLVREGLEAVLLVAALLAYLVAAGAGARARRQIWAGVGAGILATAATWGVATVLVPLGGASRELVEGITGLLAVVVLLYVSNWLFQKTYIHDWKEYLRQHVGHAVSTGSALAMASLAFAAVYREGFETVLFFQALLFDAGPRAVLVGAVPGAIVIGGLGYGIIRLGVKLPLRKVFALTNAVLLYLAFTFVGKGLYSLQEAGLFTPHPLHIVPDAIVLRQLLGLYPVAETLAAQLIFVLGVTATYAYHRHRLRDRRAAAGVPVPGAPELRRR